MSIDSDVDYGIRTVKFQYPDKSIAVATVTLAEQLIDKLECEVSRLQSLVDLAVEQYGFPPDDATNFATRESERERDGYGIVIDDDK